MGGDVDGAEAKDKTMENNLPTQHIMFNTLGLTLCSHLVSSMVNGWRNLLILANLVFPCDDDDAFATNQTSEDRRARVERTET